MVSPVFAASCHYVCERHGTALNRYYTGLPATPFDSIPCSALSLLPPSVSAVSRLSKRRLVLHMRSECARMIPCWVWHHWLVVRWQAVILCWWCLQCHDDGLLNHPTLETSSCWFPLAKTLWYKVDMSNELDLRRNLRTITDVSCIVDGMWAITYSLPVLANACTAPVIFWAFESKVIWERERETKGDPQTSPYFNISIVKRLLFELDVFCSLPTSCFKVKRISSADMAKLVQTEHTISIS